MDADTGKYHQKHAILYLDDDKPNLEVFFALYESYYTVITTQFVEEAFEILAKKPVKVIVSDQRMSYMSGVDFFSIVAEKYPFVARILLTGYSDLETIKDAINLGHIYSFVNKPFDFQSFKILLDRAIESFDLQKKNNDLLATLRKKNIEISESEERYKNIIQSVTNYIYKVYVLHDKPFRTEHTASCKLLTGYSKEEFDTDPQLWIKIIYKEDYEMFQRKFQQIVSSHKQDTIEHRLVKKNGEIIWITNTIILFKTLENGFAAYNGVIKDVTEKKQLQERLFETILETEEKERRRFAGDLHDELGPQLATMRIYVSSLKKRITNPEQLSILDELTEIIKESITNVREISNNLSPHLLDNYGLTVAINSEIEAKRAFYSVQFDQNINELRFEKKVEISIYRIVKELLNNTLKYAKATKVNISISYVNSLLYLSYTDNGIGFNYDVLMNQEHSGLGLLNISSRVKSIQGTCKFESSIGNGLKFILKVPTFKK